MVQNALQQNAQRKRRNGENTPEGRRPDSTQVRSRYPRHQSGVARCGARRGLAHFFRDGLAPSGAPPATVRACGRGVFLCARGCCPGATVAGDGTAPQVGKRRYLATCDHRSSAPRVSIRVKHPGCRSKLRARSAIAGARNDEPYRRPTARDNRLRTAELQFGGVGSY